MRGRGLDYSFSSSAYQRPNAGALPAPSIGVGMYFGLGGGHIIPCEGESVGEH